MSPHRAARLAAGWHASQARTRSLRPGRPDVRQMNREIERVFRRWLESDLVNRVLATGVGDQP